MAKLFFRYVAMNSGKTTILLQTAHNYEERGMKVLIIKPQIDSKGEDYIVSRIGLKRKVDHLIEKGENIFTYIKDHDDSVKCILVDEAQFLKKKHVFELAQIVDELHIPVIAFGLKNDFQNHLFEGSEYLLLYADKIEEMKTICWFCGKKATMNLRLHNGKPVYEGEQIKMGGNESYYPVCRRHYYNPPIK